MSRSWNPSGYKFKFWTKDIAIEKNIDFISEQIQIWNQGRQFCSFPAGCNSIGRTQSFDEKSVFFSKALNATIFVRFYTQQFCRTYIAFTACVVFILVIKYKITNLRNKRQMKNDFVAQSKSMIQVSALCPNGLSHRLHSFQCSVTITRGKWRKEKLI